MLVQIMPDRGHQRFQVGRIMDKLFRKLIEIAAVTLRPSSLLSLSCRRTRLIRICTVLRHPTK